MDIGTEVDGEDDVDVAVGRKRTEGNVLTVLAAVDEGQLTRCGNGHQARVEASEGVGRIDGNIIAVLGEALGDVDESIVDHPGEVGTRGEVAKEELVEEGARGAHDEAELVEAGDADIVVGDGAGGAGGDKEVGGREGEEGRVPAAHLEGVELEGGRVDGDDLGARGPAVRDDDGERRLPVVEGRRGGESVGRPAVLGVDELEAERLAPVVGEGRLETRTPLRCHLLLDRIPVLCLVEDGEATGIRPVEDGVLEGPEARAGRTGLEGLDGGEVVGVEAADESGAAREAGDVGGRLEQAGNGAVVRHVDVDGPGIAFPKRYVSINSRQIRGEMLTV